MTTALDLIKRAQRLLNVYAIGEDPSASEAQDGLTALNSLLDSLANSNLLIYAQTLDAIPLAANQPSVTVGPTGSFVTARPVEILESSNLTYQGVEFPLVIFTLADYNRIAVTNIGGIPSGIWPLMNNPDITITPWPLPAQAMTLNLWSNKLITSFPTLTTVLTLPPGYERMLAYLLAIEIAPEYEREPSETVVRVASQARKFLKRTNVQIPRMQMPYGIPDNVGSYGGYYL
jgi:hypothetical protein